MRIAVFGTGGAGAYFGAQLARAGEDVIFLARGEHLQAIRTQGLRVGTAEGEIVIRPTHASDKPAEVGVVDAVLVGETHFVKFGELNKRPSKRAERLRQAFERAGVKVETPTDIHVAVWEKFLFVVSWGGIGALARAPVGVTRSVPETRQMIEQSMREIFVVACARQIALPDQVVEKSLALVDTLAPGGTTSLQRDIAGDKPSELDAWNGAAVRLGQEVGVATPLHELIYSSLLPLELRARGKIQFPA